MEQSPKAVVDAHRDKVVAAIAERPGWEQDSYVLGTLLGWEDSRLPIIVAIPKDKKVPWSPMFAVLGGGRLVSNFDADAFARIAEVRFSPATEEDARAIARAAVLFGAFNEDVGRFVDRVPGSAKTSVTLPRPDDRVAFHRKGADAAIAFYAFNYETMALFDCEVVIGPAGVRTSQRKLPRTPPQPAQAVKP